MEILKSLPTIVGRKVKDLFFTFDIVYIVDDPLVLHGLRVIDLNSLI